MSWPLWRADNPAGLLLFVQPDEVARRLPGLPARAEGRGENLLERVETIYAAFAGAHVRYADEPIAGAGGGQLIRPPDEIFQIPRHGNCLDLSVAFAGACLAAGVHPLIVVCEPAAGGVAHAVVVVWLRGQWTGIGGHRDYLPPGGDQPMLTTPPLWPDGGLRASVDDMGGFLPIDITRISVGYGPDGASFAEAVESAAALLTTAAADTGGCRWQFGLDVGRFYDQRSALAPPGQPRVPALEAPYQVRAAAGSGPLAQLRARNSVVSFQSRRELDLLLGWCRAPAWEPAQQLVGADEVTEPLRIAVVEGIGGAGKTHLAAELAHRLAGTWHTGFLTGPPAPDGQSWLVRLASPLLVVIDYVERWPTAALRDLLRELATRRRRTAVLFTARFRADWWSTLDTELTRTGVPRQVFPQLRLDACHPDAARLFNRAYRRFADTSEAVDDPDDPVDTGRWTTLELVMLAWLAARTDAARPASRTDLFNEIIDRELVHWADTIKKRFDDRPAVDGLRLAAAHVSLLSPTRRQLTTVLRQAGIADYTHLAPAQLVEGLAQLAGDGHDTLALRPDPVAEYLILDTFPADPAQYAVAVDSLPAHKDPHVVTAAFDDPADRFCDNLTRTAERSPAAREAATRLAETALTRQITLWPQAFAVALHRGGPFVTPLTDLAERDDSPLPLRQLNTAIPLRHTELRHLALIASTRTMPPPPDDDTDEHHIAQWAAALATLANRQSDAGHPAALDNATQASAAYRRLAEANPGAYLPDLAMSLNNLGILLSELGRREEALTPSQDAVTIYRRLAEANPGTYLPDLAASLNNLGILLSELGRREEALTPSQDAVTIYRRLAEMNPGTYLPDLAASLNNLGILLSELGRREEALTPSQDAVTIYRRLAEANPGTYLPDLAASLNNLGILLSELGRKEEALTPSQDAVTIRRRLAEANPGTYLPDLAASLNNLGILLSKLGRREEALTPSQDAVTIRRRLAEANPGTYLPDLAASLNNLGIRLSELGRREEALTPSQDAVTIRRRLAEMNPGTYLPDLAASLNNLGIRLSKLGRKEEALTPSQDAVTIRRRLAETNPGTYLPDLAMSLNNLGIRLSKLGRREEALTPSQDAVTIYRRLAEMNPGTYLPDLAMSLNNLGILLSELGRQDEAVTAFHEAGENMDPGPRAELDLTLARWRARQHDPAVDIVSDIIRAADRADHEDHPQRGARARRAVRAAIAELQPDNPPAGIPIWATAPLPDATLTLLNRVLTQASWAERATVLRSPAAMAIRDPSAQPTRAILAALCSDNPTLVHLLHVLDTADEHGLDAVLEALQAAEEHQSLVRGWLGTPNWTASRRFLREHPGLLNDPRTIETLAATAGDPTVRQHLAIARLAATTPIDTVYDIVLDVSDAIDAAIAAIDIADLDQLAEVWFAAPALSRSPFIGPYLAAILTARHSDGADQALDLIRMAADHGDKDTRTTAATRLSALAVRLPELAELLRVLAGLLIAQPADGRHTATDQDSIT